MSSGNIGYEWDDLRFPAVGINPPGLISDPGLDTTNGCFLFDAAGTEAVVLSAQLPHAWNEGTSIVPHIHWQKTSSAVGNVLWRFEYKWAPINEVMDANFTPVDSDEVVDGTQDTNTANKHLITSFGELDCTGRQISDMLIIRVSRIGGDDLDTYDADARFLEFDIHYRIDAIGSAQQFRKHFEDT
jgi:hypothetical protein